MHEQIDLERLGGIVGATWPRPGASWRRLGSVLARPGASWMCQILQQIQTSGTKQNPIKPKIRSWEGQGCTREDPWGTESLQRAPTLRSQSIVHGGECPSPSCQIF